MIEEHVDPTIEAHAQISNLLRTLVTAAAGIAERRAALRQAEQQEATRRSETERRAFEQRIAAERQTAELAYRRAYQDRWWDQASPEQIAAAVEAAGTWADADRRAEDALDHIAERLAERYHIDLARLQREARGGSVPAAVREQVREAERVAVEAPSDPPARPTAVLSAPAVEGRARWEAEVRAVAGEDLGRQILGAEGWPRLQDRLDKLAKAGKDPTGELRNALAGRELGSAVDKAITLSWRLKETTADTPTGRVGTRTARHGPADTRRQAGRSARPETAADRLAKKQWVDRNQRDTGPESGR